VRHGQSQRRVASWNTFCVKMNGRDSRWLAGEGHHPRRSGGLNGQAQDQLDRLGGVVSGQMLHGRFPIGGPPLDAFLRSLSVPWWPFTDSRDWKYAAVTAGRGGRTNPSRHRPCVARCSSVSVPWPVEPPLTPPSWNGALLPHLGCAPENRTFDLAHILSDRLWKWYDFYRKNISSVHP
jgi:hypothetical protein